MKMAEVTVVKEIKSFIGGRLCTSEMYQWQMINIINYVPGISGSKPPLKLFEIFSGDLNFSKVVPCLF